MFHRNFSHVMALGLVVTATAPAIAADRVLVSAKSGGDGAGCGTPVAPCRTFQGAHDALPSAGGEIEVMDPGDYGPVAITKSVSIVNDGVGTAGVLAPTANGAAIDISAGASDKVVLRGLTLLGGAGGGSFGVRLDNASLGSLTITKCVIKGFNQYGVVLSPASPFNFTVSDTFLSGNTIAGLRSWPQSASVPITGVIEKTTSVRNGTGGFEILGTGGGGSTQVTITKSVASNNNVWGVHASNNAIVSVRDTVASDNGSPAVPYSAGFVSNGGLLRIAHSVAAGNLNATFANASGVIESYGDNNLRGNVSGHFGTDPSGGSFTTVPNR